MGPGGVIGWFEHIGLGDRAEVGGKGGSLGELRRAGIEVTEEVEPGYWEERGYDIDAWVGRSNGRDDEPTT